MPTYPNASALAPERAWFKSSYSEPHLSCVEAAHLTPGIAIRDSKNPTGPALHITPTAWTTFLTHLRE